MTIRRYTDRDAEALVAVFRDAVRSIGPEAYYKEQVEAWACYPENFDEFKGRLKCGTTIVAEVDGVGHIAFGQLHPSHHVAFVYCRGSHARRGIGSQIYWRLEGDARRGGVRQMTTDASRISRPFFEGVGYKVVSTELAIRYGVEFERFRMTKMIQTNG